jgi:hypothetical protein
MDPCGHVGLMFQAFNHSFPLNFVIEGRYFVFSYIFASRPPSKGASTKYVAKNCKNTVINLFICYISQFALILPSQASFFFLPPPPSPPPPPPTTTTIILLLLLLLLLLILLLLRDRESE